MPEQSTAVIPEQIKDTILALDPAALDHGHVYLLPIMCGLGKSTAVSLIVKKNLYPGSKGVLILTDRTENFAAYTDPRDDEEFLEMLQQGGVFDAVEMTAKNIHETRIQQKSAPVLIACTQRFFDADDLERTDLISWNGGIRPLIIIDEKPPLLQPMQLSLDMLNKAGDTLTQFSAENTERETRDWCEEQWDRIVKALKAAYRDYEQACSDLPSFTCYLAPQPEIPEDEDRFLSFLKKNRGYFIREGTLRTLECGIRLVRGGGLISCQRDSQQKKSSFSFYILLDNRNKVTHLPALTIILDGTGDVSPEYCQEYVSFQREGCFTRDLSKLTIKIVNVPTSRQNLNKKDDKNAYAAAMQQYLNKRHKADERKVVFTYKRDWAPVFKAVFGDQNVNHFGNIKGSNEYNDVCVIAQFGLFQLPPVCYLQLYLNRHPEEYELVKSMQPREAAVYLHQLERENREYKEIVVRSILADIEQNFFRSGIRRADNEDAVAFYLFMNMETNQDLIRYMKSRYTPLGAIVDDRYADPPEEFAFAKAMNRQSGNDQPTDAQRVRQWIDSQKPQRTNGRVYFTTQALCDAAGITKRRFTALKGQNPSMMADCEEVEKDQWAKKGRFPGRRKIQ